MKNYFVAATIPDLSKNPEIKSLVSKLKRTCEDRNRDVRWVRPELWHVTLHFLGNLDDQKANALPSILTNWLSKNPMREIELDIHGLGAFPNPEHARVLWLGIRAHQHLVNMKESLSEHLIGNNFPADQNPFAPHLTLARFRNPLHAGHLLELAKRKSFGSYPLHQLILFASVLQGNIVKYIPVHYLDLLR